MKQLQLVLKTMRFKKIEFLDLIIENSESIQFLCQSRCSVDPSEAGEEEEDGGGD